MALLTLIAFALSAWGALAIYYSDLPSDLLRTSLALVFGLFELLALFAFVRGRWRWPAAFLAEFLGVVAWWRTIEPPNSLLPYAAQDGNRITLHNIRDFEYRSEEDFTPRHYDKTFDLDQLDSVDARAPIETMRLFFLDYICAIQPERDVCTRH